MRKRRFQGIVDESVKRTRCGRIRHSTIKPVKVIEDESLLPEYIKKMLRHEKPPSAPAQLKLFGNPFDPNY